VAIPAIILAAGLGSLGVLLAPAVYSSGGIRPDDFGGLHMFGRFINDWPALRLLFGLLFLNEFWSTTIIVFKNAPYWSISFEFCYYLLFGSWFYLRGMPRILAILVTALLYGPRVLLLMPIWILGVVIYRLRPRVPSGWAWIFILVPAGAYLVLFAKQAWLLAWRTDALIPLNLVWADRFAWQYCVGLLMAANLIGFCSLASANLLLKFERPIRWMASRTLSIYLFHFPILFFLGAVCQRLGLDRYSRGVLILCVTFLAIEVLSRLTEARRRDWRTALQRAVGIQTGG
jgi:peptidoglycan/LPS O-acetylase OafA/YrhL